MVYNLSLISVALTDCMYVSSGFRLSFGLTASMYVSSGFKLSTLAIPNKISGNQTSYVM